MKEIRLIPIKSELDFETLCCDIAKEKYSDYEAQKYGRRGQKQWGADILACDRKNKNERVVIQCKYKSNPPQFSDHRADKERKALKKEIINEFKSSIQKHEFERFIFASNIKRDAHIQDFADELSKEKNKEIRIWFFDDIEDEISLFPRLSRLYTESGFQKSVNLIDKDFIDTLKYNTKLASETADKNSKTDIFRFYAGHYDNDAQWLGILNNLDAPRNSLPKIYTQIENLFKKDFLDSKVAALVYGDGGCGKSTLLRRVALQLLEKGYINWWVEAIDDFMKYDYSSIEQNPDQKHIIFIDDWYRNKPEDRGRRFFKWLKTRSNVLVLIGDRKNSGLYSEHLYDGNAFHLKPSENIKILNHISERLPELEEFIDKIKAQDKLIDNISISIILFVLSHLYENKNKKEDFDLKDGVKVKFQKIIAKKLYELENREKDRGLGRALYLIAQIYAEPKLNYFTFSEESFLKTASFLGNNESLPDRIKTNGVFPTQVQSLVYTTKRKRFIHFNHDVLAEEGIIYANRIYKDLGLEAEPFDLKKLFNRLIEEADSAGALMLWIWLYGIKFKHDKKEGEAELLNIITHVTQSVC